MSLSGRYTVDPKQSTVSFSASSSVHPIHIHSRSPEGALEFGASVSGSLVVPVKTLRTGQPLQDLELRRQIQARRYPTIEATLRQVRSTAGDTFEVAGDVTFMGSTQTADGALTVTSDGGSDEVTIRGESTFDVRDFGFRPPNILGMKVDPLVTVAIELVARIRTNS